MSLVVIGRLCRWCGQDFNETRGLRAHDNHCCSDHCFLYAGPLAPGDRVGAVAVPRRDGMRVARPNPKRVRGRKKRKHAQKRGSRRKRFSSFYESEAWVNLRYRVIKHYGRECMACGETEGQIHVDHIKPRSRHPHLELNFDNMQVLCKACNHGKKAWDETDWRPEEKKPENILKKKLVDKS